MSLLQMTLYGGILILLITVIRAVAINKLAKRTFFALWGVALLRLLTPFTVSVPTALFALAGKGVYVVSKTAVADHNRQIARLMRLGELPAQNMPLQQAPVWRALWLAGVGVMALLFAAAYVWHLRRFASAVAVDTPFTQEWLAAHPLRRKVRIQQSSRITAPLTYGVFRPVIVLPADMNWQDDQTLRCVFAHEYIHICRWHALWRLLLIAAVCVHWFNPLVWVMYILALRDMELCCDEAVVRALGRQNRRAYALALLNMEETRQRFTVFASSFNKNAAEERIRAILHLGPATARRTVASVLVVAGMLCAGCALSADAAGYALLVESPALLQAPRQEMPELMYASGRSIGWLPEGTFVKLQILGRGEGDFGYFLLCDNVDEVKGQWIPLDGRTQEIWIQVTATGHYTVRTVRIRQNESTEPDIYSYRLRYTCYLPDGEQLGARYHRGSLYSGGVFTTHEYFPD